MFDVFNLVPKSIIPLMLGIVGWVGANYVYITDEIYERLMLDYQNAMIFSLEEYGKSIGSGITSDEISEVVNCAYNAPLNNREMRTDLVFYFSSFGQYSFNGLSLNDGLKKSIQNAFESGECGRLDWSL